MNLNLKVEYEGYSVGRWKVVFPLYYVACNSHVIAYIETGITESLITTVDHIGRWKVSNDILNDEIDRLVLTHRLGAIYAGPA